MTIDGRGHTSATLYEAAQSVGIQHDVVVTGIRAAWPGAKVAASAFTVQGAGGDNLALHHAVAQAPEGHVLVADVNGAEFGHWGEVLAVAAQARGLAGLVIDGGVRDTEEIGRLGFPVFSRNNSIRGTRKLFAGALGVPVRVGGIPANTGDLVIGDTDGVVLVPAGQVAAVLAEADRRVADEAAIMAALRAGRTTLDLYRLG